MGSLIRIADAIRGLPPEEVYEHLSREDWPVEDKPLVLLAQEAQYALEACATMAEHYGWPNKARQFSALALAVRNARLGDVS